MIREAAVNDSSKLLGILKNNSLYGEEAGSQVKDTVWEGLDLRLLNLTKPHAIDMFDVGLLLIDEAAFEDCKIKNKIFLKNLKVIFKLKCFRIMRRYV